MPCAWSSCIVILHRLVYPDEDICNVFSDIGYKIAVVLFTALLGKYDVLVPPSHGECISNKLCLFLFCEMVELQGKQFLHLYVRCCIDLDYPERALLFPIQFVQIVHELPVCALALGECLELDVELCGVGAGVALFRLDPFYALEEVEEDGITHTALPLVLASTRSDPLVNFVLLFPSPFAFRYLRISRVAQHSGGAGERRGQASL